MSNEPTPLDNIKQWLRDKMVGLVNVQNCYITRGNSLVVNTWTGVVINVYLLTEPVKARTLRKILQDSTEIGVGSMFILDRALLPPPDERFEPKEWLLTLHTLMHERLYAYGFEGENPRLYQVHLEILGSMGEAAARYGPPVTMETLRYTRVSVSARAIKGDWQIADFGFHAFWKDPYRARRTEYRRPKGESFDWVSWSQTTWEQARTHNIPNESPTATPRQIEMSYALLQIGRDATREEVKAAFRRAAIACHPDTSGLPKEIAEARFREVTEAYEVIKESNNWA